MVEQELAHIKEQKKLENCTCRRLVIVSQKTLDKFRDEMNQTCPAHGFRELMIIHAVGVEPAPEVDQLLAEYRRRLAESRSSRCED
jgi:hypothetical protein